MHGLGPAHRFCQMSLQMFSTSPWPRAFIPTCFKFTAISGVVPHIKSCLTLKGPFWTHCTLYNSLTEKKKRSPDDAVNTVIHTALAHLEGKDAECCLLTTARHSTRVIPQRIADKLLTVGLAPSLCNWVLNFPTDRNQSVRVGHRTSSTRMVIGLITG